ncbi:MAG: hypothetical protein AAFY22_05030, partial [Pseudomonadota bacterium]
QKAAINTLEKVSAYSVAIEVFFNRRVVRRRELARLREVGIDANRAYRHATGRTWKAGRMIRGTKHERQKPYP